MRHVEIDLGNKTRRLKFTYNSVCDIEEKAKAGIAALLTEEKIGFNTMRLLVWGGMKWENRGLTVEVVGNLIEEYIENGGSMVDLMGSVAEALEKCKVVGAKSE